MHLKIKNNRPVDPLTISAIRAVKGIAEDLGMDTFIVGATARIILLEHVYGLSPSRATRDIDFAFAVETWEQFQAIKKRLVDTASFVESPSAMQRLTFNADGSKESLVIDIIPFGGLESHANMIAWPPDMSVMMNVVGYRDTLAAACMVEIAPDLIVPIASLPSIAMLKIFAWLDRGHEDPKDAIDLVTLLRQYHETGNLDRLYAEAMSALEECDYDIELAGAWLLGYDAASQAFDSTRQQIKDCLTDAACVDRLITDMARALRNRDDATGYARALLEQFQKSFSANN